MLPRVAGWTPTTFIWSGYYLGNLLSWQKRLGILQTILGFYGKSDWNFEKMLGFTEKCLDF